LLLAEKQLREDYKMRNYIVVAMSAVLLVSALVLSGCKSKESEPESEVVKRQASVEANPEAEKAAIEVAGAWLKLIDDGKYSQSWDEAAEYVKALVNRDDWQKSLRGARQPLGRLVSRELKTKSYTTSAPGAPDGQYVIIQYDTSFQNKVSAIETVTPMLDKDGKWKVSGYYIR